jgi:MtaA/CmuA family methyltransferase
MNGKERILRSLAGEPTDSLPLIPISMMAAADAVGEKYGAYIKDASVHAKGQIAFAERWDVDHVSAISCPTTEAADLGATVIYYDNQPPAIDEENALLANKSKLGGLRVIQPGTRMTKRLETLRLLKKGVAGERLVEGWVEGPVAEASDLRGINRFMVDFYDDPEFVRDLFAFVFENAMAFARLQKEAGAEIMGVGDAASSLTGPDIYGDFIWEWQKRYASALHEMGLKVRLHICGNITFMLPMLKDVDFDILDLDSMVSMEAARRVLGPGRLLSGNIDPVRMLRNGSPEDVARGFAECLAAAGGGMYAVNAGCEVPRDTPIGNLEAMRRFARSHVPVAVASGP